jgi:hypothetical protein
MTRDITKELQTHKILYHCTPTYNIESITHYGILPNMAEGKNKVSWYTTYNSLFWSLSHVSRNKLLDVSVISICEIKIDFDLQKTMKLTNRKGIYTTKEIFYPITIMKAEFYLIGYGL